MRKQFQRETARKAGEGFFNLSFIIILVGLKTNLPSVSDQEGLKA